MSSHCFLKLNLFADGCGPVTADATSSCTVLVQDVAMDYVGDAPNIRGLLLVATSDSLDPASLSGLGLSGVSGMTVLQQPPTVQTTSLPVAPAPTPPPINGPGNEADGIDFGGTVSSIRGTGGEPQQKTRLDAGPVVGIALACLVLLLALVFLVRRRRPRRLMCRPKAIDDDDRPLTSDDEDQLSAFLNELPADGLQRGSARKLARVLSENSSNSGGSGRVQHIKSLPVDDDGFPLKEDTGTGDVIISEVEETTIGRPSQQHSRELEEAVNTVPSVRMLSPEEIPSRPRARYMDRNYISEDTVQL